MNRFEHQYNLDISEDIGIRGIDYEMAKQCALIAVNEIWNALESARVFEEYDYWQEVKQEIENI